MSNYFYIKSWFILVIFMISIHKMHHFCTLWPSIPSQSPNFRYFGVALVTKMACKSRPWWNLGKNMTSPHWYESIEITQSNLTHWWPFKSFRPGFDQKSLLCSWLAGRNCNCTIGHANVIFCIYFTEWTSNYDGIYTILIVTIIF